MPMLYGLFSDIHFGKNPYRFRSALRLVKDVDILLLAGDIVDYGSDVRFGDVLAILEQELGNKPVFTVSGNHDAPYSQRAYTAFAEKLFARLAPEFVIERSQTGAYRVRLDEDTELIGLNPEYHQKRFSFPEHGEQLAFLEVQLGAGRAGRHIVMCHAPLIAHNPQRSPDQTPYFPKEQDIRLQSLVERYGNILFLSGHTHYIPTVERDEAHRVIYINDGSICPTVAGKNGETEIGNVFHFDSEGMIKAVPMRVGERK